VVRPEHGPRLAGRAGDQFARPRLAVLTDSGLESRKKNISTGLAYANTAAGSNQRLLVAARPPLKTPVAQQPIGGLHRVADHEYFTTSSTPAGCYPLLGRQALTGDTFSFYICDHVVQAQREKGGQPVY